MAKSETFSVPVNCVDVVLAISTESFGRLKFKGVSVCHEGGGKIELWGGNNSERAEFRVLADRAVRRATSGAVSVEMATEAQISYLHRLVLDDPGAATTIGASPDGSRVTSGLSKAAASKMIEQLKSGI